MPAIDQPWLAITGVSNGIVSFAFTANPGPARTANLTVLGQQIPITQAGSPLGAPTKLIRTKLLGDGSFQFSFTNTPGAAFTVLFTTDLSLPLSQWTPLGAPVENPAGQYLFTGTTLTNSRGFYRVRSP